MMKYIKTKNILTYRKCLKPLKNNKKKVNKETYNGDRVTDKDIEVNVYTIYLRLRQEVQRTEVEGRIKDGGGEIRLKIY